MGQGAKTVVLDFEQPVLMGEWFRTPSGLVLETAVNGQADLLVTFNERDCGTVPERFGIQLATPHRAMERIGK
jgi:hypothetical protein